MKKIFYLAAATIATAVLGACNNTTEKQWQSERDSILNVNTQQSQVLDDLTATLVEVSASLDSLTAGEEQLKNVAVEGKTMTRQQMLENISTFKALLAANRTRLNELEQQLAGRNDQLKQMSRVIQYLNAEIRSKEATIEDLQQQLASSKADVQALTTEVSTLNSTVGTLQQEAAQQQQTITDQQTAMSTVYYTIGTSHALKDKGLVTGGFLKKNKANASGYDNSLFTKADSRTLTQISIPGKSPKVLSGQPADSYTITENGNAATLQITNAQRFWNASKYLIIQIK